MTDEPSSQLDNLHARTGDGPHNNYGVSVGRLGPTRRPPVLDDVQVWTDNPVIDYQRAYESMCERSHVDNATIDALRTDLSAARYERDIWWPLGFCVGVLCGIGLGVWLS
jgi:hypothetical protein